MEYFLYLGLKIVGGLFIGASITWAVTLFYSKNGQVVLTTKHPLFWYRYFMALPKAIFLTTYYLITRSKERCMLYLNWTTIPYSIKTSPKCIHYKAINEAIEENSLCGMYWFQVFSLGVLFPITLIFLIVVAPIVSIFWGLDFLCRKIINSILWIASKLLSALKIKIPKETFKIRFKKSPTHNFEKLFARLGKKFDYNLFETFFLGSYRYRSYRTITATCVEIRTCAQELIDLSKSKLDDSALPYTIYYFLESEYIARKLRKYQKDEKGVIKDWVVMNKGYEEFTVAHYTTIDSKATIKNLKKLKPLLLVIIELANALLALLKADERKEKAKDRLKDLKKYVLMKRLDILKKIYNGYLCPTFTFEHDKVKNEKS